MKVIAVLEGTDARGGGFNQALNAIVQMRRLCEGRFDFEVFTDVRSNLEHLSKLGVAATHFSFSLSDRLARYLTSSPRLQVRFKRLGLAGRFERKLLEHGCDLAYFVTPSGSSAALQRLNYIATVWDLCHRDTPEFPEVREFGELTVRDDALRTKFAAAFAILTDSTALAEAVSRRYGIDHDRLLAMPFAAAPQLESGSAKDKAAVLGKYRLQEGYFFYPAQFWAHKNHIRILQAMLLLKERSRVVFAGGDQGNRRHVEDFARKNGIERHVRFLGFVPAEDLRGLYEGCAAVVMPTYFGPTNLPPLEAWLLGKPLVYSRFCAEQAGDAALCVDPDSAEELARAMRAALDPATAAALAERGKAQLQHIDRQRAEAEAELLRRLVQFEARRRCWA